MQIGELRGIIMCGIQVEGEFSYWQIYGNSENQADGKELLFLHSFCETYKLKQMYQDQYL